MDSSSCVLEFLLPVADTDKFLSLSVFWCVAAVCVTVQLPRPVVSVFSKLLGPLLCDQAGPSIVLVSNAPAQQGPAAGMYGGGLGAGGGGGVRHQQGRAGAAAGGGRGGGGGAQPSPAAVEQLVSMGFSQQQALQALRQSGNDVQTAIALLVGGS